MKKTIAQIQLMIVLGLVFFTVSVHAQDIKARMKERLPIIIDLKARGLIGEDAAGFLQFVGNNKEKADVVSAENADRKAVYESIAAQQGTSADLVGQRRAIQIAGSATPGDWLQDASGKWYQK